MLDCANVNIPPNPCCDCPKAWSAGRNCDCGKHCKDLSAYVEYRNQIAELMRGGMRRVDAIRAVNVRYGGVDECGQT